MQQLGLNQVNQPAKGFWARQFQTQTTDSQTMFDWIFGIVLPLICFIFDPIVFKGGFGIDGDSILGEYRVFAYLLSFVSIMSLAAWLVWGAKLKALNAALAGLFITGAVVSFAVGAVLFPFSAIGLMILIGALGFTPLLTGLVYFRSGLRALRMAKPYMDEKLLARVFLLAGILSSVVPYALNVEVKKVSAALRGDALAIRAQMWKLKYLAPALSARSLKDRYYRVPPENRQFEEMRTIAEAYRQITGRELDPNAPQMVSNYD